VTEKEFVSAEIARLKNEGIKNFPDDFINEAEMSIFETTGKTLFMGNHFFNKYEIITADGSPVFQEENLHRAKYIVYSSRTSKNKILIPQNETEIKSAVENFEKHLDSLLISIHQNYSKNFPQSQNKHSVINEIFRKLNLVRI
jgi:hypothetical protein